MDLSEIKTTLKETYRKTEWWILAQKEVQISVDFVIDHIEQIGIIFRDTFIALFKFEHALRTIQKEAKPVTEPSPLFGNLLPEECYQCGIYPTRILLHLDAWADANDADVHLCMIVCHQIDALQKIGFLQSPVDEDVQSNIENLIKSLRENRPK